MRQFFNLLGILGVLTLVGCKLNNQFAAEPTCSFANDTKVFWDTLPLEKIQFLVRVIDQNERPIANARVLYSYNSVAPESSDPAEMRDLPLPLTVFTQPLLTDSLGYLVITSNAPQSIQVTGSYSSTSHTMGSSGGLGAILEPVIFGFSSSSSTTTTQAGFSVRIAAESDPILLMKRPFAGNVEVLSTSTGPSTRLTYRGRRISTTLPEDLASHPYVRGISIANSVTKDGLHWSFENISRISRRNPNISCAELQAAVSRIDDSFVVDYLGANGPITCEQYATNLSATTCDSNWTRTVREVFQVDLNEMD